MLKKHLIITDELLKYMALMNNGDDIIYLIIALIKKINGMPVDEMSILANQAFDYLSSDARIKNLILEENIKAKEE